MATNPLIANAAPLSAVPTTDIQAQAANLERQRRYAQMLMQQPQAQGQIVSGHFVAPSWTQYLAGAVNQGLAGVEERKALKEYADVQKSEKDKLTKAFNLSI